MDEEIKKELQEMGISEEDLQNPEKVEELAKEIEEKNKLAKEEAENKENANKDDSKKDEILNDKLGRLAKAIAKRTTPKKTETDTETEAVGLSELDVDNRVFLKSKEISPEVKSILENYTHLPSNKGKSFEEIYNQKSVQADIQEIETEQDAERILDANADEDKVLQTKNSIAEKYANTDKEPETEYEKKVVVEKELEDEGFKEY